MDNQQKKVKPFKTPPLVFNIRRLLCLFELFPEYCKTAIPELKLKYNLGDFIRLLKPGPQGQVRVSWLCRGRCGVVVI